MFKQVKKSDGTTLENVVLRITDGAFIPFDPDNTDYQAFKADLDKGVDLQDAEGNVLTTEQVAAFLQGLA